MGIINFSCKSKPTFLINNNYVPNQSIIIEYLTSINAEFHTFHPHPLRHFRIVIQNFHHSIILDDIELEHVSKYRHVVYTHVVNMKRNPHPLTMFCAQLALSDNNKDIHKIRTRLHSTMVVQKQTNVFTLGVDSMYANHIVTHFIIVIIRLGAINVAKIIKYLKNVPNIIVFWLNGNFAKALIQHFKMGVHKKLIESIKKLNKAELEYLHLSSLCYHHIYSRPIIPLHNSRLKLTFSFFFLFLMIPI